MDNTKNQLKKRKNIVLVCLRLANGGAERVLSIIANELAERGYSVRFVILLDSEDDYSLSDKVTAIHLKWKDTFVPLDAFTRWSRLRKILVATDTVVVAFLFRTIFWVSIATAFSNVKTIFSERNDPRKDPNTAFKRLLRNICYLKATKIVFQNNTQMALFSKIIRKKGVVIPNPIGNDLPYHNPDSCENVVISVCRYERQKNILMAIKAFQIFHFSHRQFEFHIYGRGSMENEIRDHIKSLGLEHSVKLMGYSNNIYNKMQNAMIFISTSNYEGMSNSILEAMAIGLPVVCTDCPVGVNAELIKNGQNGILVKINDHKTLALEMSRLCDSVEMRKKISVEARHIRTSNAKPFVISEWSRIINEGK